MTQQQTPQTDLPYSGEQPARKRPWAWVAVAVLAAGAGVGATLYATRPNTPAPPAQVQTITIQGDVTVPADTNNSDSSRGGRCFSDTGYKDISAGAQINITNQAGTVLATGVLNDGLTSATLPQLNPSDGDFADKCSYHFIISDVSGDATNYGIQVGNTFRGVLHYSKAQVQETLDISIG